MGSLLSSLLGSSGGEDSSSSPSSSEHSRILSFHSSPRWQLHFNDTKESSKLMVVDFTASWCGPCKMMEPVVHAIADKFTEVEFAKIDVDELPDVAQEFGVQAMPTFVLVKGGKEVDRVVGARKDELERKIAQHRALQAAA